MNAPVRLPRATPRQRKLRAQTDGAKAFEAASDMDDPLADLRRVAQSLHLLVTAAVGADDGVCDALYLLANTAGDAVERAQPGKVLQIVNDGTSPAMQIARSCLSPTTLNTITAETFIDHSTLDVNAAIKVVRERADKVIQGDMSDLETTLVANVQALDALFGVLSIHAHAYLKSGKLQQFDMLMRLGLKAQSQVRTTIDSLAEIKNPRPLYAKNFNVANGNQQVNNAAGPQQVNNQPGPPPRPRGKSTKPNSANKLLGSE